VPQRDPALIRRTQLILFKKDIFGRAPVGTDQDPSKFHIPEQLEMFNSDIVGSRFGTYPQPGHTRRVAATVPDRRW
jgi:hypothetical protein